MNTTDIYFKCAKLSAIITTKCCAKNKEFKQFSCQKCLKPDYLEDPNSIVDIFQHLNTIPSQKSSKVKIGKTEKLRLDGY